MLYAYHVLNNLGHTLASALFHVQQPSAVSVGHICLWSSRCSNNQLGSEINLEYIDDEDENAQTIEHELWHLIDYLGNH